MSEDRGAGLTLLVSLIGPPRNWVLRMESLAALVSRVLLVTDTWGSHLLPILGNAFPGTEIEQLHLDEPETAEDQTGRLRRLVGGDDRWILLLEGGGNAVVEPGFRLPDDPVPHNLLHRSPDGAWGFWATALIPGDPAYLSIAPSGKVVVDFDFDETPCNDDLVIDAPHAFEVPRKTLLARLDSALAAYRRNDDPELALEIACCYFDLGKYRGAGLWYRRCLPGSDDPQRRWLALYRLGRCLQFQGSPWPQAEAALVDAFDRDPDRAEPLYHLSRHYFDVGDPRKAFELAEVALPLETPASRRPFELSVYTHELPLLYMACADRLGRDRQCIRVANQTLRRPEVPETARVQAAGYRTRCLARLHPLQVVQSPPSNRIVVICPFRNAGTFLRQCAESLAAQDYENCRFLLIDDASTDGALDGVDTRDPRFMVLRNESRLGGLANQAKVLEEHCAPDDIAVYLDGDDRLLGSDALRYINDFFNAAGCWVMYGQYRDSEGCLGRCEPIVEDCENALDAVRFMHFPMHIRAHRAGLFHRLREVDPELQRLRDDQGEFLEVINDMTMMRAIMQLAGLARIRYNDRVIYEYNVDNPQSHFRERKALRERQIRVLDARPVLQPVASYRPATQRT